MESLWVQGWWKQRRLRPPYSYLRFERSLHHDQNPQLKEKARAAKLVIDGQNPNGGWVQARQGRHTDLSVTGYIQALPALTGITDPQVDEAMDKAVEYVKKSQDSAGRFKYKIEMVWKTVLQEQVLSLQIWENAKSPEAGLDYIVENNFLKIGKKLIHTNGTTMLRQANPLGLAAASTGEMEQKFPTSCGQSSGIRWSLASWYTFTAILIFIEQPWLS